MIRENYELTRDAREKLKGNWKNPIIISILVVVIPMGINIVPLMGPFVAFFLQGAFALGLVKYYLNFVRGENPDISSLFDGFNMLVKAFVTNFLIGFFVFLWSLLLVIPGIIAATAYSQTFFVLADNPTLGAREAIKRSKVIMDGNKWKFFCLTFRFIGWMLLATLTCGIGFIFLTPYMTTTYAEFYEDIKDNDLQDRLV